MANTTIGGIAVEDTAPDLTDLLESEKDPAGTPLTRKATHGAIVRSTFQVASAAPSTNTDVTVFVLPVPLSGEFLDEANNRYYVWNGAKWQQLVTGDF